MGLQDRTNIELAEPSPHVAGAKVICPQCGAADDITRVIDPRGSFSLPIFLFSGLITVLFHNAGKARRVRCNKCETRFYVSSPLTKISRVIFWLFIALSLTALSVFVIKIICVLSAG